MAGTLEEFIISIAGAAINQTYTFALQAYDDAGLASPVSNYVQGRFQQPVKQPQPPQESGISPAVIAIIVSAIVVVIAVMIGIIFLCKRRK